MSNGIYVSINKKSNCKIVSGVKNHEFRNYIPKEQFDLLYVYETAPTSITQLTKSGFISKKCSFSKINSSLADFLFIFLEDLLYIINLAFSLSIASCLVLKVVQAEKAFLRMNSTLFSTCPFSLPTSYITKSIFKTVIYR